MQIQISKIKINYENFNKYIYRTPNCWFWTGCVDRCGYGYYQIFLDGKRTQKKSHRLAYAFANNRLDLIELPFNQQNVVMHLCNNKLCCNPDHLKLGTNKENSKMASDDGLYCIGEKHKSSKLTNSQVNQIRSHRMPHKYYADLFGVSKSLIQKIILNKARLKG